MKEISIIIPIYNCKDYLVECLDSIANQTYPNNKIEVIMINDGTKDDSDKICRKYSKKYDWIFIDRKENKGVSYTRNEGVKKSSANYIMFLDSDDYLKEDAVEKLLKCIKKNKADLVISKLNSFNSSGEYGYYSDKFLNESYCGTVYDNKKLLNCISVCAKVYRKSYIYDVEFPVGKRHEDNYYSLVAMLRAKKICVLPEYTYYRRICEGDNKSFMQNLNKKTYMDLLYNFRKIYDEISDNDYLNNFMIKKLMNYIIMNIDKGEKEICLKDLEDFKKEILKNYSFLKRIFYSIKYKIYYIIGIIYKKIMK